MTVTAEAETAVLTVREAWGRGPAAGTPQEGEPKAGEAFPATWAV